MNCSEDWKVLWPISAVIAAPKLLTNPPNPVPPTVFSPSSPPTLLISSPSLSIPITPPLPTTIFRDTLHGFLYGGIEEDFVPLSVRKRIVSSLLADHDDADPTLANNLRALHCRDGSTFVIFLPTGENGDKVAFFAASMKEGDGGLPVLIGDANGSGVFKQLNGYRHSCHRIVKIEVCPVNEYVDVSEDSAVEGYVLATTMYSVNWFRVEIRCLDPKGVKKTPFLLPVAKQGFKRCVVHACWNPYFVEESVVLLETGELFCINLESKQGSKIEISCEGVSHGEWLGCEFGAQPWILIVASSKVVFMVDLRSKGVVKPNVLANVGNLDSYTAVHSMKDDRFIAFCCAEFDRLYFTVVSEHHVFLFNVQQPSFPLLTWDHGINHPSHVSMFKLSDIRLPEVLSQTSKPHFSILVGSFWNSKFKLFSYGSNLKDDGASGSSSMYAWELPSSISLSGRECGTTDSVFGYEDIFNEELKQNTVHHLKKELVLGFCLFPRYNPSFTPENDKIGGFDLIRFISSGKIEFQRYCASSHFSRQPSSGVYKSLVSLNHPWDQEEDLSTNTYYLKFDFLLGYMNNDLCETLGKAMYKPQPSCSEAKGIEFNPDLWELIKSKIALTSHKISDAIGDASLPANIHEITSRRILASLPPILLYLAFSTYPELFDEHNGISLEFFQVPSLLAKRHLPHFLVGLPSGKGERWSHKERRGAALVGPVLPLPVLLILEQFWTDYNNHDCLKELNDENLLVKQCGMVRNVVFPEISLSESSIFNVWEASQELQNEKPFFTYEVGAHTISSESNAKAAKQPNDSDASKEIDVSIPSASNTTFEDENFTTFLCGINESYVTKLVQASGSEMLDDIMLIRTDLDSPDVNFSLCEHKAYKCLSRQFLKWQANCKPYQDFCTSSKVTKKAS